MNKSIKIFLLVALTITSLACSIFVGGPDYPEDHIPITLEATESLQSQIQEAVEAGAENGTVVLNISEEQITSFIAFKLVAEEDAAFYDPQVYLRDGQMKIYGKVENGSLYANLLIILTASIDDNGKPEFNISSADFGPFPVPESLKQTLTALITEAYTGNLGPIASGFRLETINISDGILSVSGRIK